MATVSNLGLPGLQAHVHQQYVQLQCPIMRRPPHMQGQPSQAAPAPVTACMAPGTRSLLQHTQAQLALVGVLHP